MVLRMSAEKLSVLPPNSTRLSTEESESHIQLKVTLLYCYMEIHYPSSREDDFKRGQPHNRKERQPKNRSPRNTSLQEKISKEDKLNEK